MEPCCFKSLLFDLFLVRSADKDRCHYYFNDDNPRWRKKIKISESSIFKGRFEIIGSPSLFDRLASLLH